MRNKIILGVAFWLALFTTALSQDLLTVKGKITDESGVVLPGATIVVKNTTNGVSADFDGLFSLENVPSNGVLLVSYIGYAEEEININGRDYIAVALNPSENQLDEVVVIGYGESSRRNVTGVVASVEADQLAQTGTTNFDQALAGRVSGVLVSGGDGSPGEALDIVIRGGNSITGDNSPLFVIDGIPLEDFDPATLSTSDIKDFDILKDASAAAIYGSRGANGVVLINTKSGRRDSETVVNFGTRYSNQWIPNRLPVLNPFQYVQYQQAIALSLDNFTPGSETAEFFSTWVDPELYRNIEGTSWQDEIFRLAGIQQYNLSISGGNENTNIYYSAEYLDQEGTLINTGFNKIVNNLKMSHRLNKKTKINGQIQYAINNRQGLQVSNARDVSVIRDAIQFRPVEPINSDGLLLGGLDPNDPNERFFFNPVLNLENTNRVRRSDVLRGVAGLDHKFNKNLTFRVSGNYQVDNRRNSIFFGADTQQGVRGNNRISGQVTNIRLQTLSGSATLNFKKKIGNHSTDVLVGSEFQDRKSDFSLLQNNQIPTDIFGIDNIGIGTSPSIPQTSLTANTLQSFFGRLKYSYKDKYLLTATFRADGSSRFQDPNRFGYFPAFSAAWQLGEEEFMKKIDFINDFKIRAGWAEAGNNRIGDFDAISQLSIAFDSGSVLGNGSGGEEFVPGAFQSNLGVPGLRWETTEQVDVGVDIALFNSRVNLTGDYYRKRTRDLLLNADTSPSTGFQRVQQNVGAVENSGVELSFNAKIINNKNFKWTSTFNIAFNNNETLALNRGQNEILTDPEFVNDSENSYITRIGQPVGQIFGLEFDGIYQPDDFVFDNGLGSFQLRDGVPDNGATVAPGSVKFVDQNGDGTINELDRVIIGNTQAKHFGGFNNTFQIGNFDLGMLWNWSYGFDILNGNRSVFTVPRARSQNGFVELLDAWTPTNTDTDISTIRFQNIFGRPPVGNLIDNRFVEDGSFLKLRTVTFGYSFPKDVMEKLKIKNLRIYVTAQNVLTITNYSGYDPEVSVGRFGALTPNLDYSAYPQSSTATFGLDITF